jgi:hypothetical protein
MNLINVEEYFEFICANPLIANELPVCELLKKNHDPLGDNDIILLSDLLGMSRFPNSFIDIIINYKFNTLCIGNVTFGEIPNTYAYALEWLMALDMHFMTNYPMECQNLKAHNCIIVAKTKTDVVILNVMNGVVSAVPQDLNLKTELKIALTFTDFMSYLVTGVFLNTSNHLHILQNIIASKLGDKSVLFWQSVFPANNSQNTPLN